MTAVGLLSASNLTAALGKGATGYQDNGGYTATYDPSFVSTARAATLMTRLNISLTSYPSPAGAAAAYQQLSKQSTIKLAGVGDKAARTPAGPAIVLKGSQILAVTPGITPAGSDYIGENDKSSASIDAVLDAPTLTAVTALAKHLTGTAATSAYLQLPEGAVDPCQVPATTLAAATKKSATSAYAPSESVPAQQCNYTLDGHPYLVQTFTGYQAAHSIPSTTLAAEFTADQKRAAPGKQEKATDGRVSTFMNIDSDWTVEILIAPAANPAKLRTAGSSLAPQMVETGLMLHVRNAYTFTVDPVECAALMNNEVFTTLTPVLSQLGPVGAAGAADKLTKHITAWCAELAKR